MARGLCPMPNAMLPWVIARCPWPTGHAPCHITESKDFQFTSEISRRLYVQSSLHLLFFRLFFQINTLAFSDAKSDSFPSVSIIWSSWKCPHGPQIMFLRDLKDSKFIVPGYQDSAPIPNYSDICNTFRFMCWLARIHLCFKIIRNYSRCTKIPPSYFSFFFNDRKHKLFWTKQNTYFPQITKYYIFLRYHVFRSVEIWWWFSKCLCL